MKKLSALIVLLLTINIYAQDLKNLPFIKVTEAPRIEGQICEDSKQCFKKYINEYVSQNFNGSIVEGLQIQDEQIKILAYFKVNTNGFVEDVRVRAPLEQLKTEFKKVILSVPKMKPATYEDQVVSMVYSFPLIVKQPKQKDSIIKPNKEKIAFGPRVKGSKCKKKGQRCIVNYVNRFVSERIKISDIREYYFGIEDVTIRAMVFFKIDQNGDVVNLKIRAKDKVVKDEISRVFNLLGKFEPAQDKNGKKVTMLYSLPISFKI